MEIVNYKDFCNGTIKKSWTFEKVFPDQFSNLNSQNEVWITEERLKVPVGKKKVGIRFFKWFNYNKEEDIYECSLGIVPDYTLLDEKTLNILSKITKNKIRKNPYFHMLRQSEYHDTFLKELSVKKEDLTLVSTYMDSCLDIVEKNLMYFLEGGINRSPNSEISNGWAVLVRARSGSI